MTFDELKQIALHAAKGTAPANYTNDTCQKAFLDGIRELAGTYNQFMKNRYDIYDIIIEAADEIVPKEVIDRLGMFAEIKVVGQNQKATFKKGVGKMRAKKFLTEVGLSGVYDTFRLDNSTFELAARAIGGGATVDFERMLDGNESLVEVMQVLTEGLQDAIFVEVQKALRAAYDASDRPPVNKATGSTFNAATMAKLCSVVKAYGQSAAIFAPPEFIAEMGADAIVAPTTNYHGMYSPDDIEAIHNTGLIRVFRGCPVIEIPQSFVDTDNKKTWIDPQMAYILPTGGEKVVKIVLEGPTQVYDFQNRDNSYEVYMYKKMGCAILCNYNWAIYQNTGIAQTYYNPYGF